MTPTENSSFSLRFQNLCHLYDRVHVCFVVAWTRFLGQHTSNEIGICLARFVAEKLTSEATENAQNVIEKEPTVDRTLLKDLILQHTNDATKNLKTELNSLRNQLSNLKVKNTPKRGQRQGASNKNKKRNGDQASTKTSAQRGRSSSPKKNKKKTPKGSANQGGSNKGSSNANTASK
jgi:hypothetical protein